MMSAREVEKKRICQEIVAEEMARAHRRKLEEEVRRELVFEREMGIPIHMSLEPPPRPQPPIMDHAEIKQNSNQNQLQERVNLRLNPKLNQVAIEDTPQPRIIDPSEIKPTNNQVEVIPLERVNLRWNPKSSLDAIEYIPQPLIMNPSEIKPTKNSDQVILLERVNQQLNPKSNQVAIEDMPQPGIMDPAEIKPASLQDERVMRERVHLRLNPKSNLVAIEDMPQPRFMDPAEINQDEVIPPAKPDTDLYDAKKTAEAPAVNDSQICLVTIPKKEWGCMLCGVTASDENSLNVHLNGKKHKAKEAALGAEKIVKSTFSLLSPTKNLKSTDTIITTTSGLNAKADIKTHQALGGEDMTQQNNQDEVMVLAKPDTDLYDAKKIAEAPAVNDSQICLITKPKKEWGCMLCGVTASDENSLNVHLNGKKHKAKEAALGAEKIVKSTFSLLSPTKNLKSTDTIITTTSGLNAKADIKTHQALGGEDMTQQNNQDEVMVLAKPDTDLYDAKKIAEAPAVNDSQICLITKPKKEWGCMLCGVTASDENSLNVHLNGKKHKAKEAALGAEKIVKSTFSLLSPTKNLKSTDTIITTTSGLNAKADIKTHQALGGEDMTQQNNQDEVMVLAKPDTDLYDAKKIAEAPAVNDSQICLITKPKKEWGCMLCGVTASDENSLNVHLNGKKHKAKEAALGAEKIVKSTFSLLSPTKNLKSTDTIITTTSGLNAKEDIKTHQALGGEDMTQQNNQDEVMVLAKPDTDLYDAKKIAEAPAVNDSQICLITKPKKEWGCMLCGVTASNENSLNVHLNGKKHKAKEAALGAEKIVKSTFSLLSPTKNLKSTDTIITTTSGLNAKADIKTHQALGGEDMTQHNNQNEVIVLNKPDTDLYDTKRKAEAPSVNDSQIFVIKKPKKEWGCMLCGVTLSDDNSLNVHLNGKKHKAKEAAQEAEKIVKSTFSLLSPTKNMNLTDTIITTTSGLNAKEDIKTHQALGGEDMTQQNNLDEVIVQAKPDTDLYDAKRKAEAPAVNDFQFGLIKKHKKEWGCMLCGVTAPDENSLNGHLNGKKHKAKEAALGPEKIVKSTFSLLSSTKNLNSTETIITTTSGLNVKADIKTHQALGGEDMTQQNNQDEVIVLAKPDTDLYDAKRKAEAPAVNDSQICLIKEPKKEWGCMLCGVTASDENSLKLHLNGKKHKAKEAALEAEKIVKSTFSLQSPTKNLNLTDTIITTTSGLNAKEDIKRHQALGEEDMTQQNVDSSAAEAIKEEQVVQKSQNIGVSEINEVTTVEADKTNAFVGREMKFWGFKLCGVTATDASSLNAHLCGKKPDTDLYDAKPKAEAPAVNDSQFGLIRKPKKEWGCMLCGVTASDESSLNWHLNGKKHNAKEAALGAEKIVKSTFSLLSSTNNLNSTETIITTTSGLNVKADIKTHQALGGEDMTQQNVDSSAAEANKEEQVVQKSQNIGVSEINEVTTLEADKTNAFVGREMKFWGCKLCGVTATDASSLNAHLCGKKHKAKEAALEAEKTLKSTSSSLSAMKNVKSTETIINTTSGLYAKACGGEDEAQQKVDSSAVDANKEEQVVQKSQNIGVSEINEVTTEEAGKANALVWRKRELWCDICGISTTSQIQMEDHKRGSKHRRRMEFASYADKFL